MSDISVVGLGVMGSTLANALLQNGFSVTVWNRSIEKTEPLASAGAKVASSVEEAISASPATITCIASHEQTISLLGDIGAPSEVTSTFYRPCAQRCRRWTK